LTFLHINISIGEQIIRLNADIDVDGVSVSGDIALIEFENVPTLNTTPPIIPMTMNENFQEWKNNRPVHVFKNGATTVERFFLKFSRSSFTSRGNNS
jgi:hypothetical protein